MFENVRSIPLEHLADYVRAEYRTAFAQDVAEGRSLQLTVPYVILGAFIAPMLWLAIPQLHSPWMRFMRWLVVAFIMAFNLHVIWDVSSGTSFGAAYVIGLTAAWGMISTANFLVWNHAHRDAARIVKRVKEKKTSQIQSGHGLNGSMDQIHLRRRNIDGTASPPKSNGTTRESSEIEYEYIWEPFPEAGTFSERFLWSFDLMTDLRFVGWNWRPSALPRVKPPLVTPILYGTPVDMSTMPSHTEAGYRLPKTESEFLWGRLKTMAIMYLALDFLATRMCMDPFFLLGPEYVDLMDDKNIPFYMKHDESLQPVEQLLILWGLAAYRQVFSLAAVAFSISIFLNGNDLAQYYIFSYIIPCRGELWQQPPTFGGSIRPIIDRGIAGLWGSLWHQTFRVQFAAPSKWLLRRGYVKKGTPVAGLTLLLVSFLQSGLLHCAGGVTAIPPGNIWRSIGFFLSQALGIIIQTTGAFAFRKYFSFVESSRFTCQMANGIFMMIWLHLTGMLIVWDITYAGAWLLEPIPFSFLRMLGFGFPEDRWWRWNPEFMPWWYTGKHWWQSGITL